MRPTTRLQGLFETCWHSAKMCELRWRPPSKLHGMPPVSTTTTPFTTVNQPTTTQMRTPKLTLPPFRNHQAHFPALKTTHPLPNPPHTWADKAAQSTNTQNQQPLSSVLDSIKSIFAMFDFHKLCIQLRSLAIQLQESNDPITKLVVVIDTVVGCFSPSP